MPRARKMRQRWYGHVQGIIADLGVMATKAERLAQSIEQHNGHNAITMVHVKASLELAAAARAQQVALYEIEWENGE